MTRNRLVLLIAAAAALSLLLSSQASAAVTPLPPSPESAKKAGEAILEVPEQLISAELPEYAFGGVEPGASPLGVGDSSTPLTGFPTFGSTWAILSSGNMESVATDHEQSAPEPEVSYAYGSEASPNPAARGDARDWTVLKLNVNVPGGDNCAALDYRFLSEEFPNFVGSEFNDAFIAEVDANSWSVNEDGSLVRPSDFAASPEGEPISVDGVGPTAMSPAEAEGTYFNAATGLITTKTPVAEGPNSIYLSIFDASDEILDSAVFLDNLRFINESPATCKPPVGAQLAIPVSQPGSPPPPPSNAFTLGSHVKFKGGFEATLSVTVPGPGTVSASSTSTATGSALSLATGTARASAVKGKGKAKGKKKPVLLPASVQATAAGTVQITVKLSSTGKKLLLKQHKLTVPVTVSFTPTGGTASSQQVKVTFKTKAKKHKKK
ncbi:MAG TPA: choice-of-anchor L domain-containing protein [Solirubrobacterales bacterium]|jgi:hypothetical protein